MFSMISVEYNYESLVDEKQTFFGESLAPNQYRPVH